MMPASGETAAAIATVPLPRAELEAVIARIWAEMLGVDSVGLHDNFLLLGGESLLAMQIVSEIRAQLGVDVPIRSIFVGTVAQIAAEIAGESAAPREACMTATA